MGKRTGYTAANIAMPILAVVIVSDAATTAPKLLAIPGVPDTYFSYVIRCQTPPRPPADTPESKARHSPAWENRPPLPDKHREVSQSKPAGYSTATE